MARTDRSSRCYSVCPSVCPFSTKFKMTSFMYLLCNYDDFRMTQRALSKHSRALRELKSNQTSSYCWSLKRFVLFYFNREEEFVFLTLTVFLQVPCDFHTDLTLTYNFTCKHLSLRKDGIRCNLYDP